MNKIIFYVIAYILGFILSFYAFNHIHVYAGFGIFILLIILLLNQLNRFMNEKD